MNVQPTMTPEGEEHWERRCRAGRLHLCEGAADSCNSAYWMYIDGRQLCQRHAKTEAGYQARQRRAVAS